MDADKSSTPVVRSLPSRERGLKYIPRIARVVTIRSLPSRERGLKSEHQLDQLPESLVAPFAGAWIEIEDSPADSPADSRRSLRGSVD